MGSSNLLKKILDFIKKDSFKKYFENTSWLFFEKLIKAVIGVFVTLYVANYLGPEKYGILVWVQSVVGLLSAVSTLGINSILVRELVKERFNKQLLLGTSFFLRLIGSTISVFVVTISLALYSSESVVILIGLLISIQTTLDSFLVIDTYFQSQVQSKYTVYVKTSVFLVVNSLNILAVVMKLSLIYFAAILLISSFLQGIGLCIFYVKLVGGIFEWKFKFGMAKKLLKDSWPLIPHNLSFSIFSNIDQFMIGLLLGNQAVGIYGLAYKLIMKLYDGISIFSNSFFPALIKDGDINKRRFIHLYRFMLCISGIIIVFYFLLGQKLIPLLFDVKYQDSIYILNILIIACITMSMMSATGKWYVIKNYTKLMLFRSSTGAIINLILNYILILSYGLYGAVFATLFTTFYISYLSAFLNKKTRENIYLIHQAIFSNN